MLHQLKHSEKRCSFSFTTLKTTLLISVTKESCIVGIADPKQETSAIMIYPNPITGELTIDNGESRTTNVEIYDAMGKKLFENKENLMLLHSHNLTLLSSGIYFAKIETEYGTIVQKIVKP